MIKKVLYIVFFLFVYTLQMAGSQKYCIYFTDKSGSEFNPESYLQPYNNEMTSQIDSIDFPLNREYIKTIETITGEISSESRWLNAVIVKTGSLEIEKIRSLSFVKEIEILNKTAKLAKYKFKATLHTEAYTIMSGQLTSMQGNLFANNGYNGRGVRIAIFDVGFTGADKSPVFEHLRKNGQIIKTYDFVRKTENVYGFNHHGTMVLSCLAGRTDGKNLGMATGAEYLLARTESNMETLSEEEYWLQAVEWAYQNNVDIINSSLGYTYHRYFEKDMDGKTSLVARAAAIAASKGILVVNAMGNDGESNWQYMCTPADVENVMAVGGIDPNTGIHIPFSSFGPTADKRMKPNVSAYAHVITGSNNKLAEAYGTSFASPLVAGFAACVLQMHPDYNMETLFEEIEKSGNLYPYFDYAHGYGIPQADYFVNKKNEEPISVSIIEFNEAVVINSADGGGMLYYHIQQPNGTLEKYGVAEISSQEAMQLSAKELKGKLLRVHYKGSTTEKQF